ncbi:hypothetical protein GGP69_001339 [Salinibacter ruber]|nr:hypothetical protein [Salinibacter ruber]
MQFGQKALLPVPNQELGEDSDSVFSDRDSGHANRSGSPRLVPR